MVEYIHHVAFAFYDLDKAIKIFRDILGIDSSPVVKLPSRGVHVVTFDVGESQIEILAPYKDDSPVKAYLDKNGEGFFYIAFGVEDIVEEMTRVNQIGYHLQDKTPRQALNDQLVAFIAPQDTLGLHLQYAKPATK
jgi:methylmalonyl-CoA/ethylmalonyl-CoA epimerase